MSDAKGVDERCVVLKGGDFDLPYTLGDGICIYPNRRTADQSRKSGDVVVEYDAWKDWEEKIGKRR